MIELLWRGFQMIGGAVVGIIRALLGLLNLTVPEWTIEIAMIIILLGVILKFGKYISKIFLVILLVLLASTFFNALLVN